VEKFADEALIEVSSGRGGNGCVAFRREKFVPRGGPSGGDGGRGGDVVFIVRRNLRTLAHLRHKQHFKAENGHDGEGRERYGRNGGDVVIPLPPGSVLKDPDSGELIRDFGRDEAAFVFLKGGAGGWGNVHFKSPVNQAPRKALPGRDGESRMLRVELQIMADIGFVGFPNAGKSSLLERFTNARPKIAPYPFTTKIPNLGVLASARDRGDEGGRDIILADIPGLIEGASDGAGLGIRFLKHISRTRALLFLIDLSSDNYLSAFDSLLKELSSFSAELAERRRLIVGTKLDLEGTADRLAELEARHAAETVLGISVFSGAGLAELASRIRLLACDSETAGASVLSGSGERVAESLR
jgi:GTP-binding protein